MNDQKDTNQDNQRPVDPMETDNQMPETPDSAPAADGKLNMGPELSDQSKSGDGSGKTMQYVLGGIVVVVALGLLAWFMMGDGSSNDPLSATSSEDNQAAAAESYPDVVAVVNGTEIGKQALIENVDTVTQQMQGQGMGENDETSQAMIEEQALNSLVNTELLLQAADDEGLSVSEADVDAELASVEEQLGGAEALQERIDSMGLDMASVRSDIRDQLTIDAYLAAHSDEVDATVTEEEKRAFYEQISASNDQIPSYEEIADQIEAQLAQQAEQQALSQFLEELRAEADIEVLI